MQPSTILQQSSIPMLFQQFVETNPQAPFVHVPTDNTGTKWRSITRQEAYEQVVGLAYRLHRLGVQKDTKVAIWANTRAEWCWIDMAVLSLGGVTVGIYPTLTTEVIVEQLQMADVDILIVEHEEQYINSEEAFDTVKTLRHVLTIEEGRERVQLQSDRIDEEWYQAQIVALTPDTLATIVFTSGSTGKSKGVMLSHQNFLVNLADSKTMLPLKGKVRSIVCLPLAHSLQRFVVYRAFVEDIEGYFAPSLSVLKETLYSSKPTLLVAVPRMLEKIQQAVNSQVRQRSVVAERLLHRAIELGWEAQVSKAVNKQLPLHKKVQLRVLERLVLSKVKERLGGSLKTIISGGAPLQDETAKFFWALNIQVVEGWGLSESCAPATLNIDGVGKLGSVGQALPQMTISLGENGELLLAGGGVFQGYYRQESSEVFTDSGAFKTGDLGRIDSEGFVYITGRLKDIIVTAGGKNIAPRRIESKLDGGLIHHSIVIGDQQPYLVALIALDEDVLSARAKEAGWVGSFLDWTKQPSIQQEVEKRVCIANQDLASFEQIKKFVILSEPLTEQSGLLTSTQKIKRGVIQDRFSILWQGLYT